MLFAWFRSFLLLRLLLSASLGAAQCPAPISSFPYFENFDLSDGGWVSGGQNNDWAWGPPAKNTIQGAASAPFCWIVGGLSGQTYQAAERSFVKSPCFDFSNLQHPYLQFNIWWESEHRYDGAALQFSLDEGAHWTNLGTANESPDCFTKNWFNTAAVKFLDNGPAWSGNVQNTNGSCLGGSGSGAWVEAAHCLSELAGKPRVQFRFTFGSGTTCNDFDGVAFDDFFIGEAAPPLPDFSFEDLGDNTFVFFDHSENCPETWLWDFGEPSSGADNGSTEANPKHQFCEASNYEIRLKTSNTCSGEAFVTKTLRAEQNLCALPNVFIPNVFRPNSAIGNDFFGPFSGESSVQVEFLRVYNRWGELVFERQNFPLSQAATGWDGRFREKKAPAGVYAFVCSVLAKNGKRAVYSGDVLLLD